MMSPLRSFTIYRCALSGFLLPTGLLAFSQTEYFDAFLDAAARRRLAWWVSLALCVSCIVLQMHYLATLARLVRAGGRIAVYNRMDSDPVEIARRRCFRFRAAAIVLSMLAAFGIAELGFRVLNIKPPPPAPLPRFDSEKVDNTLNALGIREPWDSLPEDDRRLRIAFLGDSMVYGYGVARHQTFCYMLEQMLAADSREGVAIINLGYVATSPGRQLPKYLALRETLHPDVVVHVVYPNDLGIELHKLLYRIHRIHDKELWFGTGSRVVHYAEKQVRYRLGWNDTIDYFRGGRNREERAKAWAKFKGNVRACKAAVEEGGAVYALVLFPWLVRLDDYLLTDVHRTMREFAAKLDVPYLDLLEVFAGRRAESLRVSLANEHPNVAGHRLAANRIARFLCEELSPRLDR